MGCEGVSVGVYWDMYVWWMYILRTDAGDYGRCGDVHAGECEGGQARDALTRFMVVMGWGMGGKREEGSDAWEPSGSNREQVVVVRGYRSSPTAAKQTAGGTRGRFREVESSRG